MLLAMLLLIAILPLQVNAASLRVGSRGEDVKTVQTKLKRWGYYSGGVDGIFGTQTKDAVVKFQQTNSLTADGVVGPATAKALGMPASGGSSGSSSEEGSSSGSSNSNLYLLAKLVHGEARGESHKGRVAVAAVVLNRMESASFPNSMAGVIYQSGAFSVVADGQINLAPNQESINAARDALNGWDPTNGCLYYYNPAKTSNQWMLSKPIVLRIGNHVFF